MNHARPVLNATRAAHIAECKSRKAPPVVKGESVEAFLARGGQVQKLPGLPAKGRV